MIKLEKTEVIGWEHVIRGMRNPMNSWAKSVSLFVADDGDAYDILGNTRPWPDETYVDTMVGDADRELMMKLAKRGPVHGKFRRMIGVYVDITAPLYWWKEFDTYKVGTVANSCSTMHKIHAKEFTLDDFSHEYVLSKVDEKGIHKVSIPLLDLSYGVRNKLCSPMGVLYITIDMLNICRRKYLETKDKLYWWQMIQLLPSSYNQKRTVMLNYEVLANIYQHRHDHKLDEWRELCRWIEQLPYSEIITCNTGKAIFTYKELYEKFITTHPFVEISDYRPYPLCDNSIIVWVSKFSDMPMTNHKEIAFRYDPQKDIFTPITDAKSYDELLNGEKEGGA